MITSFVDGRIRIRDERLKNIVIASHIEKSLSETKGITDITINQRVGSLLILYDKTILKFEQLLNILADYLAVRNIRCNERINSLVDRNIVNIGMLTSLAVSIIGIVVDITTIHVTGGIVFLLFLAFHIFRRYKNMLLQRRENVNY